jgi:hypothetical protein
LTINLSDLDVLEYWKTNEGKYPELSRMARDVLSIPITTTASESTFNIGGHILDKHRSVSLPDNVEALLCTHDWLLWNFRLISIEIYILLLK